MCECGSSTQDRKAGTVECFSVVESERNDKLERFVEGKSTFERIIFKSDLPKREETMPWKYQVPFRYHLTFSQNKK